MHAIRLAVPTDVAGDPSMAKNKASGEAGANAFPAVLAGARRPSGEAAPRGNGRSVQRLLGGQPGSGAGAPGARGGDGGKVNLSLLRHAETGFGHGEGEKAARQGAIRLAESEGRGDGRTRLVSVANFRLQLAGRGPSETSRGVTGARNGEGGEGALVWRMPAAPSDGKRTGAAGKESSNEGKTDSSATHGKARGEGARKAIRLAARGGERQGAARLASAANAEQRSGKSTGQAAASSSADGDGRRATTASRASKGGGAKRMSPTPAAADAASGKGRPGTSGTEGAARKRTIKEGHIPSSTQENGKTGQNSGRKQASLATPNVEGKGGAGQRAGGQRAPATSNGEGTTWRTDERTPEGARRRAKETGAATGNTSGKDGASSKKGTLLARKRATAEPDGRRGGMRGSNEEGRSSRSTRGGRTSSRHAQGRGQGQQRGGHSGQGGAQNGNGRNSQGGQGAKPGAASQSFSASVSNASTSGESDGNALRASLTREASATGSGTQGTDGKGAGGGANASTASGAKSSGRVGGGSGPPRTMPSAWLNAAKQGGVRTAELAGGWKSLEMSLGEDKGTMTVKARQGQEHMAVSVGFSEARVQAQVVANARQLQEAMQAEYGTDVDLSFGGEDADGSDQETPEGGASDRSAALTPGETGSDEDGGDGASLRSRGRREWVG